MIRFINGFTYFNLSEFLVKLQQNLWWVHEAGVMGEVQHPGERGTFGRLEQGITNQKDKCQEKLRRR